MKNLKTYTIAFLLLAPFSFTNSFAQTDHLADSFSQEKLDQWMEEVSNWGRWGDDDQLGTLNLITPQVRKEAATLVQTGQSVSLAMDLDTDPGLNNSQPLQHTFTRMGQWTMDTYSISYHGYAHSHLDAQRHIALEWEDI